MDKNPVWLLPSLIILILLTMIPYLQKVDRTGIAAVEIYPVETDSLSSLTGMTIRKQQTIERMNLTGEMEYFFDSSGMFDMPSRHEWIDENSSFFRSFHPAEGKTNWGVINDVCWFRVILHSKSNENLDLYASNLVDHTRFILPAEKSVIIYYRLHYNDASMVCRPSISTAAYHERIRRSHSTYISLLLGLYIALFIYNLFLAIITRDRVYPPYLAALFFYGCYMIFRQYDITLGNYDIASALFPLPASVCLLLFTRNYLKVTPEKKILWYPLCVLFILGITALITRPFFREIGLIIHYVLTGLLLIFAIFLTGYYWRREWKKMTFFILSWIFPLSSALLFVLQFFGIIKLSEGTLLNFLGSNSGFYLVIGFQMLLFALDLGNRINEEKHAKNRARKESRRLHQENSTKENILLHVTHEIRSTLMISSGLCEGLLAGQTGTPDSRTREIINSIYINQGKLNESIDRLLLLTRLETSEQKLELTPTLISPRLNQMAENYRFLAESKKIYFKTRFSEDEKGVVDINTYLFDLVIENLLGNAFKNTPENDSIEISSEIKNNSCIIAVQNGGPGIPEERREDLFEKMTSTDTGISGISGTGLGLYLVKQSVTLMNAAIDLEQNEKSTCFRLIFPLSPHSASLIPKSRVKYETIQGKPSTKHKKNLLLVEDNQEIRELIASALKQEFKISMAEDGLVALEYLDNDHRPDLIISDVAMPRMNGLDFFKEIRLKQRLEIPVIFLSAVAGEEERNELLAMGAVDFLPKPFSLEILLIKIRNLLNWKDRELKEQKENLKSAVLAVFNDEISPPFSRSGTPDWKKYSFSKREKQVIEYLLQGMQDKQIAGELGLATSTVSNYLQRIYKKTKTGNRSSLLRMLYES